MKHTIHIINRVSGAIEEEQIWGESALRFVYGKNFLSKTLGALVRLITSNPLVSKLWGAYHDREETRKNIEPFCKKYSIDTSEFEQPLAAFSSFNDFFVRKLKRSARPIDPDPKSAILPADARYLIFPDLGTTDFLIKGVRFKLEPFLQSPELAKQFQGGVGILARLCPTDCHRFVFPVSGRASPSKWIAGSYLSVSPIATHQFPAIFWTNVRELTLIESEKFGLVAMVEIGATNCASIIQTYTPGQVEKGQETGYFRLGGSAIMLLFEKDKLELSEDLITLSKKGFEIRGLIGQKLGSYKEIS